MKAYFKVFLTLVLSIISFTALASTRELSSLTNKIPNSSTDKIRVEQPTQDNRPTLKTKSIGSLPSIEFDGVNDFFTYNGESISNNDYSILL